MSELEARTDLSDQERLDKKDEMLAHYGVQSERVHTLQQLLKAYTMFNNNDEYVVMDGQVKIVDEHACSSRLLSRTQPRLMRFSLC